jgi:hypothetical protein
VYYTRGCCGCQGENSLLFTSTARIIPSPPVPLLNIPYKLGESYGSLAQILCRSGDHSDHTHRLLKGVEWKRRQAYIGAVLPPIGSRVMLMFWVGWPWVMTA